MADNITRYLSTRNITMVEKRCSSANEGQTGGIYMDIAEMSMSLASSRLGMAVSTSIAKKAMDTVEMNAEGLNKMLEAVEQIEQVASSANIIDVRA